MNLLKNNLLTFQNTKFLKTQDTEWFIVGLSLSPSNTGDGKTNLCKFSSKSCVKNCVGHSGRNGSSMVQNARRNKTLLFLNNREEFLRRLSTEIYYWERMCKDYNKKLAVRLNTYSDIDWSKELIDGHNLFTYFPSVTFYDYSKDFSKLGLPNYHLTYSYDMSNHTKALKVLERGDNLAVVFEKKLPKTFYGYKVIDGNNTDLRFLDEKNVVVGLSWKNVTLKGTNNAQMKLESTLVIKQDQTLNKIKDLNLIYE